MKSNKRGEESVRGEEACHNAGRMGLQGGAARFGSCKGVRGV
jgi:hypothetical protein